MTAEARSIRISGVVQGVGFRPFVYRLARRHGLTGWVRNDGDGVELYAEGPTAALETFVAELQSQAPEAARITNFKVESTAVRHTTGFTIEASAGDGRPTVRIAPDLPVCRACLDELADLDDRRRQYPYINCTECGPRYSIVLGLPYDRPKTTMSAWPMCADCRAEYDDPGDRRFHAQPVACPECGPNYRLLGRDRVETASGHDSIVVAAGMLGKGEIVAVKGLGGYHLACDARNAGAVAALRTRKFRKEKPFAVMVARLEVAYSLVELSHAAEKMLTEIARPIVLARAKLDLPGVAPDNPDLGVMLPYTPVHHLLFSAGCPEVLVMTSANRSSEPIAYDDDDAFERLDGIADAFLAGERPIARRVDDSVAREGPFGPVVLRRSRGYAPDAVASVPAGRPILAVGADLKNTVTLVVDGQAFSSQHIGDLEHLGARRAFEETIVDLLDMYRVDLSDTIIAHDAHPGYASTTAAAELATQSGAELVSVQHHRAHVASVAAEREELDRPVVGFAFDGTGYGDDGAIWGGEVFAGSVAEGFERVAHLRPASLPGGDAAARHPVQAAAGFLSQIEGLPDLTKAPFEFPDRYRTATQMIERGVRTFTTTSMGRLFDTVAALLGFTRAISFEGQAAIWLEHLARSAATVPEYPFPGLDYRPLLSAIAADRRDNRPRADVAAGFHRSVAITVLETALTVCAGRDVETVALSGGVFQNQLLLREIRDVAGAIDPNKRPTIWTNRVAPSNDGGISLGQAAVAAMTHGDARALT